MNENKSDLQHLRQRVETSFGKAIVTSRHFDELRESIYGRTGILLSATTLKRLWGYLDESVEPRLYTLDILCRYAGWKSWQEFCDSPKKDNLESGPVGQPHIDVRRQLRAGDTVALTWLPDRVCRIRCLGDDLFEVIEAQGTRLTTGDEFRVEHIIADAPLYLNSLTRGEENLGTYVCGSKTGIRFFVENLNKKDKKGLSDY